MERKKKHKKYEVLDDEEAKETVWNDFRDYEEETIEHCKKKETEDEYLNKC